MAEKSRQELSHLWLVRRLTTLHADIWLVLHLAPRRECIVYLQKIIWLLILYLLAGTEDKCFLPCEKLRPSPRHPAFNGRAPIRAASRGLLFLVLGFQSPFCPWRLMSELRSLTSKGCGASPSCQAPQEALIPPGLKPFPLSSSPCHPVKFSPSQKPPRDLLLFSQSPPLAWLPSQGCAPHEAPPFSISSFIPLFSYKIHV